VSGSAGAGGDGSGLVAGQGGAAGNTRIEGAGTAGFGASAGMAGVGGSGVAGEGGVSGSGATGGTGAASGNTGVSGGGGVSGGASGSGGVSGGASGSGGVSGGASGNGGASGSAGAGALGPLGAIITSSCTAAQTCCMTAGFPASLSNCESMYGMNQPAATAVANGFVTVDQVALAKCVAAYQGAATQCNLNAVVAACQDVLLGTKNEDEPCTTGYDCNRAQGPTTCLVTNSDMPPVGICKKTPHGKQNDPCIFTCRMGDDCSSTTYAGPGATVTPICFEAEGLYCDNSIADAVCKAILAPNSDCSSDAQCGSESYCIDGTCQALSALGAPCGIGCRHELDCVADTCQDPLWANEYTCSAAPPGP
jgi:hypothetical protein